MSRLTPLRAEEIIWRLSRLGFEGPIPGKRHLRKVNYETRWGPPGARTKRHVSLSAAKGLVGWGGAFCVGGLAPPPQILRRSTPQDDRGETEDDRGETGPPPYVAAGSRTGIEARTCGFTSDMGHMPFRTLAVSWPIWT